MAREKVNLPFEIEDSDYLNAVTFNDYLQRLSLIAKAIFKWDGLPDTCNERYLEEALFREGQAVFYYDEDYGYLTLRVAPANLFNVYGEPTDIRAIGHNGYSKDVTNGKYVYIRNNEYIYPTFNTIKMFAYRLYECERTIDTNVINQKFPLAIITDEKTKQTVVNLYNKIRTNKPVILGLKGLDLDAVKTLDTSSPYVADKLQDYKHQIWNECMNFLGINNANTDKRERLISNEVDANIEQMMFSIETMLKTREEACRQINDMFPELNVSVSLRKLDFMDYLPEDHIDENSEVQQNG